MIKTTEKIKKQIAAITLKIKNGKQKNIYAAQGKLLQLKQQLKIAQENEYWETLLSS